MSKTSLVIFIYGISYIRRLLCKVRGRCFHFLASKLSHLCLLSLDREVWYLIFFHYLRSSFCHGCQRMPISREDDGQQRSPPPPLHVRIFEGLTCCFRPTTCDDPHQSNTNQPLPSPPQEQCSNALTEPSAAAAPTPPPPAAAPTAAAAPLGDLDLDALSQRISEIIQKAKGGTPTTSQQVRKVSWNLPNQSDLSGLKDFLYNTAASASQLRHRLWADYAMDLNEVVKLVAEEFKIVLPSIAVGMLVVGFVLERFHNISSNKEECLDLLDEMFRLCSYLKDLRTRGSILEAMRQILQETFQVVVEGAIICCAQRESSWLLKFMTASAQRECLKQVKANIDKMYRHIKIQIQILCAKSMARENILGKKENRYPIEAEGIDNAVAEVMRLLDFDTEDRVVAVTVYGIGGLGKTTLADAVYASVDKPRFKYSKVALFEHVHSQPDIAKIQKKILDDMTGSTYQSLRSTTDGQITLYQEFTKQQAYFLYIDNVLGAKELELLLPKQLGNAHKLRLLLTARDDTVSESLDIRNSRQIKSYPILNQDRNTSRKILANYMGLPSVEELRKTLGSDEDVDDLLRICGGLPYALEIVGRYISQNDNKRQAVKLVKQRYENGREDEGVTFASKSLDFFSFAIEGLRDDYVEAFYDICFVLGKEEPLWTQIKSIYGDDVIQKLQKRALIHESYTWAAGTCADVKVLDVILEAAKTRAKGKRIGNLEELKEMLDEPNEIVRQEMLKSVKVIWLGEEDMELSAKDVDLMSPSLRVFNYRGPIIGKCEETFERLLHWRNFNDVPFDFKQTPRLTSLVLCPTAVVDLSKMPPPIRFLGIYLEMISKADGDEADSIHFSSDEGSSILPNLELLALRCSKSPRLPKGLLCRLTSLTILFIDSMGELVKLRDEFQFLPSLTSLTVRCCPKLKEISNSIGSCTSLDSLRFAECDELESLTEQLFERLCSLKLFCLEGCPKVKRLPGSLTKCTSLKEVYFSRNPQMEKLPKNFECLPSLEEVSIRKCERMEGGCMDILLKMRDLKRIDITGSDKLIERWNEVKEEEGKQKMKDVIITE